MQLIVADVDEACLCHNAALVSGSSLAFTEHFATCYKIGQIDLETECLQEEVSNRIVVIPSSGNAPAELKFSVDLRKVASFDVPTIPFNLLHFGNYFHFLIEALPSLNALFDLEIAKPGQVIISGVLHPNMREALCIVTRNRLSIFEMEAFDYVESPETILIKDSFSCNERRDGKMADVFAYDAPKLIALKNRFARYFDRPLPEQRFKIFVHRSGGQRNVDNLSTLVHIARNKGFLIVNPAELTFRDQVILFSSASAVVGPTGAWLANLMFVRPDVPVHVFYPDTCLNAKSIWKGLGEVFGIGVTDHYFPITTPHVHQPIHSDYAIDVHRFADCLDSV